MGSSGVGTSGVIGLPAAATGWNCFAQDMTTVSASVLESRLTSSTTTSATITQYSSTGVATAWVANDVLAISCFAY